MKKYPSFILSISLIISLVAFSSVSALTASDISMLQAAGIISATQAASLTEKLSNIPTLPALPSLPVQAIATKCSTINTDLTYNANGDAVSALQNFLASKGYLTATSRGYFGGLTVAAVKAFQIANGISATGYVGPITRAKIQSLCSGVVANPATAIDQVTKVIQNTVTPQVQTTIQNQIQNIVASGTLPTSASSLIQSVGSQIPKIDCSNFAPVPSCSYLPDVLQAQCKVCKGQY